MKTILSLLIFTSTSFTLWAGGKIDPTCILNPNGTVTNGTDLRGEIDLSGYTITIDNEEGPVIAPVTITPQWNDVGTGLYGDVVTVLLHGNDIYICGCFEDAGGVVGANYVARWDGCDWYAVAPGIDGCVADMAFVGNDLYMGGNFTGHMAKWNGVVWDVLEGINNEVMAVAANANGVYAGGLFTNAGNIAAADGIARWTGNAWAAMGTGFSGITEYLDITTNGNDVYVGGDFLDAGGVAAADHIARWDGNNWNALGAGLNGSVAVIKTDGINVYAGGFFSDAGGDENADAIARWNGTTWNPLGSFNWQWAYTQAICITPDYVYANFIYECYNVEHYRYSFQTDEWEFLYYFYTDAGCVARSSLVFNGDDLYCGLFGFYYAGLYRYGEPAPTITITGVPTSICEDHSPIPLPTTQSGYTGNWSGDGVSNNMFNPAGWLGQNLYLLFTPTPGQCVIPAYTEIYVYLDYVPTTNIPGMCENAPPLSLIPYQGGAAGSWSGTGVVNNVFYPSGLSGLIELIFTPTPGQCYQMTYEYVSVDQLFTPVITGVPATICSDAAPLTLQTNLNGITGNWSGEGVLNNIFNPLGLNGTYILTFTPNPGQCATIATTSILVNPEVIISISGIQDSICQLAQPISLPTVQSGITGNWTGPGVGNNIFNPNNQSGNILLTFIPVSGQCADLTSTSIFVFVDNVIISGIPNEFCESEPAINLPTLQSGIQGNWNGPGVQNNTFNPNGLEGIVYITFNPIPSECANEVNFSLTVDPLTIPVISGIPTDICDLSVAINLPTLNSGINGNWTGNGVVNNTFNPAGLNGNVQLYFIPNPDQCAGTAITSILVQIATEPPIENVPIGVCSLSAPVILPIVQGGVSGNWSGTGVSDNVFYPNGLNGDYPLTFTPNPGECAVPAYFVITVYNSFVPEITGVPDILCVYAPPINLPVIQEGVLGSWSGQGVAGNSFNPAGLSGEIDLVFTPTNEQCAVESSTTIDVVTSFVPQITSVPTNVCEIANSLALPLVQNNVTGNWSGNGVTNNLFSPLGIADSALLLFNPDPNQCAESATWTVTIDTAVNTTISDLPNALCMSDDALPLNTIQSEIPGAWTGNGVLHDTLHLSNLMGMIELTFTPLSDQCALTATSTIQVDTILHPSLSGIPDSLCQTDDAFELPTIQGGIPGKWEGPGVIENIFYPDSLHGNLALIFLSQNGACEDTAFARVYIYESPHAQDLQIQCDSSANTYSVQFVISGGDTTEYWVDGVLLNGNVFFSPSIPYSQSTYAFSIQDNRGCGPIVVNGTNTCLCSTYSGTMSSQAILICTRDRIQVTNNGDAHPDPDDAITYVLHDQSGNIIGHIFSISASGSFGFLPGMLLHHPYYISVVAGNHVGNGEVDFADPCLSVSEGLSVIFYQCKPDDQNTSHSGIDELPFTDHEVTNRSAYLNDPGNESSNLQIISISFFDILGRRLWLKKNPGISTNEVQSYILRENGYPGGTYFYTIETMDGGGRKFQLQYRMTYIRE